MKRYAVGHSEAFYVQIVPVLQTGLVKLFIFGKEALVWTSSPK
jgi:hypothetical protein